MNLWPLETTSNVTQMILLTVIVIWVWKVAGKTKEPVIARFFGLGMFTSFLGDLFWSIYILLFDEAPSGISPADIAWIGAYCFLIGFLQITARGKRRPRWLFVIILLIACDTAVWVSWAEGNIGSILNDVVYGAAMCVMSWYIFTNLSESEKTLRPFFIAAACYMVMELTLFTSWGRAYAYFDFMVTACLTAMAVTFIKAVSAEEVAR